MRISSGNEIENRRNWIERVRRHYDPASRELFKRWHTPESILRVLADFSGDNLGYILFPGGGGDDFNEFINPRDPTTIELPIDRCEGRFLHPRWLTLEVFPERLSESYFWLSAGCRDSSNSAAAALSVDNSAENTSLAGRRQAGGVYMITAKNSLYNTCPSTDDGRHYLSDSAEFRIYVQRYIDRARDNGEAELEP